MARVSSTPCTHPSSPQAPCRALNATSGRAATRAWARSRPASMRTTSAPSRSSAAAHASPDTRLTSRSGLSPPIRTAMQRRARGGVWLMTSS